MDVNQHNKAFLNSLSEKYQVRVDEITKKTASRVQAILYFRRKFDSVGGQFPRWDGSNGIKSKESHKHWTVERVTSSRYNVTNGAKDPNTSYLYIGNLVYGTGWGANVKAGNRLVSKNGKLFSTQMPDGLDPWLKVEHGIFKAKIKKTFKGAQK